MRVKRGIVALSTVTDPYQPIEKKYQLTRKCLEALLETQFSVNLLTRSSLCLRDMDLFKQFKNIEVGLSITTHDERIRKMFEPNSPSIQSRVNTLRTLRQEKIQTYAFLGPMLPLDPKAMVAMLDGLVDEVLIDRMNYPNKVKAIYRNAKLEPHLEESYFHLFGAELREQFERRHVRVTHRDKAWLKPCREAINQADWLGVHCYWQTAPGQRSNNLHPDFGLCFKYYHER